MKKTTLSTAILLALSSTTALAEKEVSTLDEIFISKDLIISKNLQTPYSTESYNRQDIQESGASSLSNFLNQKTTISVQPNYGNPLAPKLDMNGFGTNGGENIQVIVDGVSINNIDSVPQQLSSISLDSIEEISILRGSGSVLYGNGATAGAIVITTNKGFLAQDIAKISTAYGSHATTQQSIALRKTVKSNGFELLGSLDADALHSQGSKQIKSDGTKNTIDNTNISGSFGVKKQNSSAVFSISQNDSAVNYAGAMNITDFNKNPDANLTSGATEQTYRVQTKKMVLSTLLANTKIEYTLNNQEKNSTFITYNSSADYSITTHKVDLKTDLNAIVLQYGLDKTTSNIKSTYGDKSRDETAAYISANYDFNDQILVNAGFRKQFFEYPKNNEGNDDLNAYNLGVNFLINNVSSIYTNINHAFLVPNFDYLFSGNSLNTNITAQESDSYTLGYKLQKAKLTASAEIFYIDLTNEIYYNNLTSQNTNLDNSHKQGTNLSLQHKYNQFTYGLGYNYVDAIIDKGDFAGKTLPAVPKHTVKLSAQYDFISSWITALPKQHLAINHKQTSESYMIDDFNNTSDTAPGYKSTDVSYQLSNKNLTLQIGIDNIFNNANGLYLYRSTGNKVYATNYERYYYVSADYQF